MGLIVSSASRRLNLSKRCGLGGSNSSKWSTVNVFDKFVDGKAFMENCCFLLCFSSSTQLLQVKREILDGFLHWRTLPTMIQWKNGGTKPRRGRFPSQTNRSFWKTNIYPCLKPTEHLKRWHLKREGSSSSHQFSNAILVSGKLNKNDHCVPGKEPPFHNWNCVRSPTSRPLRRALLIPSFVCLRRYGRYTDSETMIRKDVWVKGWNLHWWKGETSIGETFLMEEHWSRKRYCKYIYGIH